MYEAQMLTTEQHCVPFEFCYMKVSFWENAVKGQWYRGMRYILLHCAPW